MEDNRDLEIHNLESGKALTIGNKTVLGKDYPMAEGWFKMKIRIGIAVVIGTGAGPVVEGELLFIKSILFKTDKGETICNLPGRALYKIGVIKAGSPPNKDAIAAASATYYVDLAIYFTDAMMDFPMDTILDTSRYNAVALEITLGTAADLFTAPGTAAVTCTCDVDVERTKGVLNGNSKPAWFVNYEVDPPQDASSQTFVDIERADDLALKRLYIHGSANASAGVPFSGANADDVQDVIEVRDSDGPLIKDLIHEMVQNENKDRYSLEALLAGMEVIDFVRDRSNFSAIYTGTRSRLRYLWSNTAGVAAGDQVSVAREGLRTLND